MDSSLINKTESNEKGRLGVVGLGLIGASLAAAFKKEGYSVFGSDKEKKTLDFALLAKTIDGELTDEEIKNCDVIFIAISLAQAESWLERKSSLMTEDTIVVDCCGVKRGICEIGKRLSEEKGFKFIGGHPMAGKQVGGYKNSRADLFKDATFCLVPTDKNNIRLIGTVKGILEDAGFTKFIVMSPEEHDKVIAFTSQMAHLVSNAYIKSDTADADEVSALSGGAFRDMTRVAYLDEAMWTELFMENKDNLLNELDKFISELEEYRNALESEKKDALAELLHEGKNRKEEIENKKL